MKTVVLDTNVLIDNVHGYTNWVNELLKKSDSFLLVIPTIVVAEYLTAEEVETEQGREKSKKYLSLFRIQDITPEIAEILGTLLRRKTYPAGADLGDLIIASTSILMGAELATKNKSHFAKIPNLKFFDPSKI